MVQGGHLLEWSKERSKRYPSHLTVSNDVSRPHPSHPPCTVSTWRPSIEPALGPCTNRAWGFTVVFRVHGLMCQKNTSDQQEIDSPG